MIDRLDLTALRGSWALVTGASAGLGAEFARQFAAAGLNVVLVARREDRLTALGQEIAATHRVEVRPMAVDLALPGAVRHLVERLRERDIRIRVLCNNAAFGHWGAFDAVDEPMYERMLLLNSGAMTSLCRTLLPDLRSFPQSAVINVASGAAFQPVPYMAVYAGTKAYVTSFSLALQGELAGTGVQVQTLVPGPTATEFDGLAGAPAALVGRGAAGDVVRHSLRCLAAGEPFALNARGVFKQRAFAGLAPMRIVVRTVAKMFRPPGAVRGEAP